MPDDAEKSKYIPMFYSYIEQLGLAVLAVALAVVAALACIAAGRDGR